MTMFMSCGNDDKQGRMHENISGSFEKMYGVDE